MVIPKKKEDTPKDFKAVLWASADKLRAQMDAAEYKHLVLGMIFLKYISDTFLEQQKKVFLEFTKWYPKFQVEPQSIVISVKFRKFKNEPNLSAIFNRRRRKTPSYLAHF